MVWLYNHGGQSLLAMVLFHASMNVSTFLFPAYGPHYNPLVGAGLLTLTVVVSAFFWKRNPAEAGWPAAQPEMRNG